MSTRKWRWKWASCPGSYSRAFVHGPLPNAVIDNCCKDRNPALLKRLAVRFAKPVFPKDELTITGFEMPGAPAGTIGFEAKRPDGTAVVKNGLAEIG